MATLSTDQPRIPPPLGRSATLRPWHLANPWRLASLWHLTSLDAPTVAVTWAIAFACAAGTRLPLWLLAVLGLSAWTFYIADRIFDTWSTFRNVHQRPLAAKALRERHHFHWRHRRIFIPIAIAATLVATGLVLRSMPIAARERNSVLAIAAMAYFTSVHNPWRPAPSLLKFRIPFPKEMLVGILFTLACILPVWARSHGHSLELAALTACFIALAWLNCVAIETWESQPAHGQDEKTSAANQASRPIFRRAIILGATAAIASALMAILHHPGTAMLLAAASLSAALLALLDRSTHRLTPIALRAAADLALLTPILLTPMLFLPHA